MKIAGTPEDFLKSISQARTPFQVAGSSGPVGPGSSASPSFSLKASASVLGRKRDEKKLRMLIRQETTKAIKSHQGLGLSFDLFG
jgi:hypothetical protein